MTLENNAIPANTNPVNIPQGTSVEIETSAIEQLINDQEQGISSYEEQMRCTNNSFQYPK